MELFFGLILLLAVAYVGRKIWRYKTLRPLFPWKYNFGKRRDTFRATLALLDERNSHTLVETGVARAGLANTKSDGASTIVFSLWANQNRAHLFSVDIDPEAVACAQQVVDELQLQDAISLVVSDSIEYLREFSEPVDFLYLDSYDYSNTDIEVQRASQQHHLDEFKAIENKLHDNSVVLIDDCNLPGGGKGKLLVEYMTANGWQLLRDAYQALLVRDSVDK